MRLRDRRENPQQILMIEDIGVKTATASFGHGIVSGIRQNAERPAALAHFRGFEVCCVLQASPSYRDRLVSSYGHLLDSYRQVPRPEISLRKQSIRQDGARFTRRCAESSQLWECQAIWQMGITGVSRGRPYRDRDVFRRWRGH